LSLPGDLLQRLEVLAKQNKTTTSWLISQILIKYVKNPI
jgi:metal-responsive CopG/Arc/MetJ family transcriptional regulator